MKKVEFANMPVKSARFANLPAQVERLTLVLFVAQSVFELTTVCAGWPFNPKARWPEGLLLVLAAAATTIRLARQLPAQNVVVISTTVLVTAGAAATLDAKTGVPFGPIVYRWNAGQPLFDPLPWTVPLIWLVALLNARGVARLILKPWRKTRSYGFWAIGLTTLLIVQFEFAFEPFAAVVRQYWSWGKTKIPLDYYTAPWVNFFAWAVVSLLILLFITPWLINKKPGKSKVDYQPLVIWSAMQLLFAAGEVVHKLWLAVLVTSCFALATLVCSLRGARW